MSNTPRDELAEEFEQLLRDYNASLADVLKRLGLSEEKTDADAEEGAK